MSEPRTPAEYADAIESFVHAIQNATEVTRQRDEYLRRLERAEHENCGCITVDLSKP